jgi:hypothetical protein
MRTCPQGHQNPDHYLYCGQCRAPLTQAYPPPNPRHVGSQSSRLPATQSGPAANAPNQPSPPPGSSTTELEMSSWWEYACETARWLRAGNPPPVVDVWGPILNPGEQGRMPLGNLAYSRLYGGDGRYTRNNLFVFGSTDFVLGAWGINALVNQQRKAAAQKRAAVQWRDHQVAPVVVTSNRLLCSTTAHGWLPFPFATVKEFVPDLDNWSVSLDFAGKVVPLRLTGPPAPAVALWIAVGVYGDHWRGDPRLSSLR